MTAPRRHRIDPDARPYDPAELRAKPEVGIDGFHALDLRVGTVVSVEPLAQARDPAYVIEVDFGPVLGTLRSTAKITNYRVDELLSRQVVGAVNLGTKRIAGVTSQFLVLGGLQDDGTVRLLAPDGELPPGSIIA